MFTPDQYELLDFGQGRKLERWGGYLLDRPAPAADAPCGRGEDVWRRADAVFGRQPGREGDWTAGGALPGHWLVRHAGLRLELRPTPLGQVGVFPEQAANWDWIQQQVEQFVAQRAARPELLNLFAYTGASTLAAAVAGASVVHVDAARTAVAWARRNARHSGLDAAPIRWIVEDAVRFVRRELRRGRAYDGVVLDPPSYGHGPQGQAWKLEEQLPSLLEDCGKLVRERAGFLLLTCHTPGYGPRRLGQCLRAAVRDQQGQCEMGELKLATGDGRILTSGSYARWFGRQ
ncbi:MAG: class I SAM-dependent methyltransferase [Pirellulaceae bacterium]|nr:class I SAM-dependent methyltransferase [Pirellulaceae bacterium]